MLNPYILEQADIYPLFLCHSVFSSYICSAKEHNIDEYE